MLIRFSCRNFRSIGRDPLTLDMVSSAKIRTPQGHICSSSLDAKVLRNAVVYGGNAAGKSSIVRAFDLLKASMREARVPQGAARDFCRAGRGMADEETTIDVQFQNEGTTFDYGFSCILSQLKVTSEWLYELEKGPQLLFERKADSEIVLGPKLEGALAVDRARFDVYSEDFLHEAASTASALFLPVLNRGRSFDDGSPFSAFARAFSWIVRKMEIVGAGMPSSKTEFYARDKGLDSVAEVLASFDTGVSSLRKIPVGMDELEKYVPFEILGALRQVINANPPKAEEDRLVLTARNEDVFIGIERDGTKEPQATILKVGHEGSIFDFDFKDESDGTRRLFDFMDLLFTESRDTLFVVDELSRSLHPMLTQHLVKLFNQVHADDDCQLVFTTHENDIMSYEYFRRDEIWFVERDETGFSRLYSLDDFVSSGDARSDARIGKRYLEGRYGGIPVLSMGRALSALEGEGD